MERWQKEWKRYKHQIIVGTYSLANGTNFCGEWRDDKMNGKGSCNFADGGRFVGEFKDDKQDGWGKALINYRRILLS